MNVEFKTEQQSIWMVRPIAFFIEMRDLAKEARAVSVIDVCNGYALDEVGKLLRSELRVRHSVERIRWTTEGRRPRLRVCPVVTLQRAAGLGVDDRVGVASARTLS